MSAGHCVQVLLAKSGFESKVFECTGQMMHVSKLPPGTRMSKVLQGMMEVQVIGPCLRNLA